MISEMTTETTWGVDKAIVIAVPVVSLLVVCGAVLIVVLSWLRKRILQKTAIQLYDK
jgi:hypothetical protein